MLCQVRGCPVLDLGDKSREWQVRGSPWIPPRPGALGLRLPPPRTSSLPPLRGKWPLAPHTHTHTQPQGPMGFGWVPSGVLARRDLSCFQTHHGRFLLEAPGASGVRAGPASPPLGEAPTAGFLGGWAWASRDTTQEHLPARLYPGELVQTQLWNVGVVAGPPRSPGEVTSCGSSTEPPPLTQDGCRVPAGAACCTSKPCPVHTVPRRTNRGKPPPATAGVGPAFVTAGLDLFPPA